MKNARVLARTDDTESVEATIACLTIGGVDRRAQPDADVLAAIDARGADVCVWIDRLLDRRDQLSIEIRWQTSGELKAEIGRRDGGRRRRWIDRIIGKRVAAVVDGLERRCEGYERLVGGIAAA
jgi:hypothetical protein